MTIPFALRFSISDLFFWTSGLVAAIYPWAAFVCCAWSNTSTYIEWQVKRKASQRDGRVFQIHLPLSSPVCWFSISGSWGRHFLFLAGVLTPLLAPSGPLAEAPCYLLPRELCVQRVNTAWLAEQGSNLLLTLTHASTDAHKHTHTQIVTWPSQGAGGDVYCVTITTPGRIESHGQRDKQTQTSNPGNSILPVVSNCFNRKGNVKFWVWWCDGANTHEGSKKFTLTGHDSIHSGEL